MPDVEVDPSQVHSIEVDPSQVQATAGDNIQQALNYHPDNRVGSTALGLLQGAAKGVASTGYGLVDLANKVVPHPVELDPSYRQSVTQPSGPGQGTGKFLEQALEFAAPGTAVGRLTQGAGLGARLAAQAGTSGLVSAAQTGGDPAATATGAALGAAGEALPALLSPVKRALADKAPTLENFAESFYATPTQKATISKALKTLQADGIVPPDDVHATQDMVKGQISKLQDAYQNLDPAIKQRIVDPNDVIAELQKSQGQYMRRGVVTDDAAYNAIQDQIQKVKGIAAANSGNMDIDDLIHLKQKANGRTNFNSTDAEKGVWTGIGDAYRTVADAAAPETTPLNQAYQKYKSLEDVIDTNVDRGKGTTSSGWDKLLLKATSSGVGASVGGMAGHLTGIPLAGELGAVAGAAAGPLLTKPAVQALRNLSDAGLIDQLGAPAKYMLQKAVQAGQSDVILRLAGGITKEAATRTAKAQ